MYGSGLIIQTTCVYGDGKVESNCLDEGLAGKLPYWRASHSKKEVKGRRLPSPPLFALNLSINCVCSQLQQHLHIYSWSERHNQEQTAKRIFFIWSNNIVWLTHAKNLYLKQVLNKSWAWHESRIHQTRNTIKAFKRTLPIQLNFQSLSVFL